MTIAEQFRACRLQRGLTQDELAKLCQTGQKAIYRLESPKYGRSSLATLRKVAAALGAELVVSLREGKA